MFEERRREGEGRGTCGERRSRCPRVERSSGGGILSEDNRRPEPRPARQDMKWMTKKMMASTFPLDSIPGGNDKRSRSELQLPSTDELADLWNCTYDLQLLLHGLLFPLNIWCSRPICVSTSLLPIPTSKSCGISSEIRALAKPESILKLLVPFRIKIYSTIFSFLKVHFFS